MTRSWCSAFVSLVAASIVAMLVPAGAQPPAASGESLLAQAVKAEAELRFEVAKDRLYQLLLRQPNTPDVPPARLRLARLLALSGDLAAALLQCQMLRDERPANDPLRNQALELASTLARRLRAASGSASAYFPTLEPLPVRGIPALGEPRSIQADGEGRFVIFDQDGPGRVYRAGPDAATQVQAPQDPRAVAVMPDGTLLIAGKPGVVGGPSGRATPFKGTWGGRARQVRKLRSMAALSGGDLLAIDEDFDGLLRCQPASGTCAPAGPVGKFRVVKVGVADWTYLLDDRGQSVRILDAALRPITTVGPTIGGARLERVEDIAVDGAHGLYLLDRETKRLHVVGLRSAPDGGVSAVALASTLLPQDGDRAIKKPTAVGVSPSGIVVMAGDSAPRIMRLR